MGKEGMKREIKKNTFS